ncbi:hypothetical protein [Rhodococcus sp. X156]|uniref:hypothetical protein n=1 Tax=Rhodococcus sp. X156 TaxID=2499145 RepID=UPI0019D17B04|nr:hypothetical protein [Rhodococcus sp. X156]
MPAERWWPSLGAGVSAPEEGGPQLLRRLDSEGAAILAGYTATFDDLRMVLQCCERLVVALGGAEGSEEQTDQQAADAERAADRVLVESLWTTALLSYARCFSPSALGTRLTEHDLAKTELEGELLEWHRALIELAEHYSSPVDNPRERFFVAISENEDGLAGGLALTSLQQPLVDLMTVRQTGAIVFALTELVNDRIGAQQDVVLAELGELSADELDQLETLEVSPE